MHVLATRTTLVGVAGGKLTPAPPAVQKKKKRAGAMPAHAGGAPALRCQFQPHPLPLSSPSSLPSLPSPPEVVIAPTLLHLSAVASALRPDWAVAAQNGWHKGPGAFTGEVPLQALADAGVPWVILGHSERRALFGEDNETVGAKVRAALDAGLAVIACVGERLDQREAGAAEEVVAAQLAAIAAPLAEADWARVVIAYEPVWAIGTGVVATPDQAQAMHAAIRAWLGEHVSPAVGDGTRIQYGGSVTAANAATLAACADVDGFLVGGASLKPEFADIVRAGGGAA